MRWTVLAVIAVAGVIAALTATDPGRTDSAPVRSPPMPRTQAAAPPPAAAPAMAYPPEVSSLRGADALPALDASDQAVGDAVAKLLHVKSLPAYFYPDRIIRRSVASIDNLPRRQAPVRMMPVRSLAGTFAVAGAGADLTISPANSARYAAYIDAMQAVDVPGLVDLYVRFYPLFEQAYRELGYPRGHFNNRLIEALDDLLDAPSVSAPVALMQPKILYQFADPDLEARSAGQKIMIRMGSADAERAKAVLRAIRSELKRRASGG